MADDSAVQEPTVEPVAARSAPRDLVRALQRGLMLLEALGMEPAGMPAKVVSARTGLNISTCYHLLNTLVASGYAVKQADRRFCISDRICFPLGASLEDDFIGDVLHEHLYALSAETREVAYLAVRRQNEITILDLVDSQHAGRARHAELSVGAAPYELALGKVILAHMPPDQVSDVLERLEGGTMPALARGAGRQWTEELRAIRRRGYALDQELPGSCWVAAPLVDSSLRVIGSMGISVPVARYRSDEDTFVRSTIAKANAANRAIGIAQLTLSY
jgi:DNA-binding IclR family transcriptional regulator